MNKNGISIIYASLTVAAIDVNAHHNVKISFLVFFEKKTLYLPPQNGGCSSAG
ncbi:MAG TPA: hypothetical protein PLX78_06815 [Tenuifilaceae bacterium]|nr:hypothetical protein [Tenuifilaceae bacterium]HRS46453.1 hypothetical protein [Tenuifilaceae bacterium]HRV12546.1 hypothetical protein [Tenuifilaceae bacterium]